MSNSFDKLLGLLFETGPSDATNFTMKMETTSSNAPLTVAAGTDGSIILSWAGGSLTIPAKQRGIFLSMVEKAVRMSQQAVPNPQP